MNEKIITEFIQNFVRDYPGKTGCKNIWQNAIVGFADADHPYIQRLTEIVIPSHRRPQDFLESAKAVICYFVPFTREHGNTNIKVEGDYASEEWAHSYSGTNNMFTALNDALAECIKKLGYEAVVPYNVGMDPELLKSPWSQRHIAYAAGLGTFGLNNLMITESGSCGRFGSIVTDMPLETGDILSEERCLYKRNGSCHLCVDRCFAGALTIEGFDRNKCFAMNCRNIEKYNEECCGKCNVGLPCSYASPVKTHSMIEY